MPKILTVNINPGILKISAVKRPVKNLEKISLLRICCGKNKQYWPARDVHLENKKRLIYNHSSGGVGWQ